MKTLKKRLFSLALAALMSVSMLTPAFAEDALVEPGDPVITTESGIGETDTILPPPGIGSESDDEIDSSLSGTTTEGGAEENKDKTEGPAEGEEAPDPTPGTSNGTETPGQTPEGTDPPAADGDGERQHAPGCTLPADHEGDCQTEQAPPAGGLHQN